MVTPNELVSTAARFGTTTFIVDPHEAANVSGAAGIDYDNPRIIHHFPQSQNPRIADVRIHIVCGKNTAVIVHMESNVAVKDGLIAGVSRRYRGKKEIDLGGKYLAPGFIDAHLHLESTMVTPNELVSTAAPRRR